MSVPADAPSPSDAVLVLCDLVGSTALVARLGDLDAATLMREHDRQSRAALQRHGGQEIERTDGFLLRFADAGAALAFALDYQRIVHALGRPLGMRLHARTALVAATGSGDSGSRRERLAVRTLLARARPGQILLDDQVGPAARTALGERAADQRLLHWQTWPPTLLPGGAAARIIHEVHEHGLLPLPSAANTALRSVGGWRRLRRWLLAAGLPLLLVLALLGWQLRSPPAPGFAARDWIVLAALDNRSGHDDLDAPLETVLRIGLQQSRFVNVIPASQLGAALGRMRRDPASRIDRSLGAELALREGARLLVVPQLLARGDGFVLSAELVDPASAAVLRCSETAVDDLDDLLPAADRLLTALRRDLGESLAAIAASSGPLEQITTGNLEALRLFTEAERAFARGAVEDGVRGLDRALALDPEFAMARARRGIVELNWLHQPAAALADWQRALAQADKLSARERSALQAMFASSFGPAGQAVADWRVYHQLYPDDSSGSHNLGLALRNRQHRSQEALPLFEAASRSRHPMRSLSWLALVETRTELGDLAGAGAALAEADALGMQAPAFTDVLPALALRDYRSLEQRLAARGTLAPARAAERERLRAAALADRGRLQQAAALLAALDPSTLSEQQRWQLALSQQALACARGQPVDLSASFADAADQAAPLAAARARLQALAARQAARCDAPQAAALLASAEAASASLDDPLVAGLVTLARCRIATAAPAERLACLAPLFDGREFYPMHVDRAEARLAAGDLAGAIADAQWLLEHRGAAVAELDGHPLLIGNLLDSNAALLWLAQAQQASGDRAGAGQSLATFRWHWGRGDRDSVAWHLSEQLAAAAR